MNHESLRILGIDPGYERLGIAIIEKRSGGRETLLYSDCFHTSAQDDIAVRFAHIGLEVSRIIAEYRPHALAIETLFVTKNQKTAMRVAEARGIIIYEATKAGMPVSEYSPMQIKSAIAGDGTSDKARVAKMIHLLINMPDKNALDDEYDAIAVALTHSACMR